MSSWLVPTYITIWRKIYNNSNISIKKAASGRSQRMTFEPIWGACDWFRQPTPLYVNSPTSRRRASARTLRAITAARAPRPAWQQTGARRRRTGLRRASDRARQSAAAPSGSQRRSIAGRSDRNAATASQRRAQPGAAATQLQPVAKPPTAAPLPSSAGEEGDRSRHGTRSRQTSSRDLMRSVSHSCGQCFIAKDLQGVSMRKRQWRQTICSW